MMIVLLRVAGPCNCKKTVCDTTPRAFTSTFQFKVKNGSTGADMVAPPVGSQGAPDSIKLRDLHTGSNYLLNMVNSNGETVFYPAQYSKPANITDTVVLNIGSAMPDTLVIYTGLADGWRGDECPAVKDAAIVKAELRGHVLGTWNQAGAASFTVVK
jgi:hypothetical protein